MKNLFTATLVALFFVSVTNADNVSQKDCSNLQIANPTFKMSEVKNAIYYSINNEGKILDFEIIKNDFFVEDDLVIIDSRTGEEFYSHLTIYLRNGKRFGYYIQGNKFIADI